MSAQRSLVTGGSGFVGRALVDALIERGDEVTVLDFAEKPPREDVAFVRVDLRDAEAVSLACTGQDVVFHCASLVHTRHSRVQDVFDVNVGGTRHVLDACRAHGVDRLIYLSSASTVYEGKDLEKGDESLPYSRVLQAPYAASKIEAETLVLAANDDTLATLAIRPHIIFGPGDQRFIPAIVSKASAGKLRFRVGRQPKLSDFTYISNGCGSF